LTVGIPSAAYHHLMAMIKSLVNLSEAQVTRGADGIHIDDPTSPYLLRVRGDSDPPGRIVELTVSLRDTNGSITAAALGRLPLQQLRNMVAASTHPNEMFHRAIITPKQMGQRSWGEAHWREVLDVIEWAEKSKRPGGPAQAVADMWYVTRSPTAYRWIREARRYFAAS
jgi:hypothetical protein